MDFSALKWSAIAACFVFSMLSGSLWFGPKTFFPAWWKSIGKQPSDKPDGSPQTWALLLGGSLVQAICMSMLVPLIAGRNGGLTVASGATAGFLVWLGIVAPAGLVNKLFAGYLKAWVIETGCHLVNYVAFGAIIGAMG
jgi:hypothetical protein